MPAGGSEVSPNPRSEQTAMAHLGKDIVSTSDPRATPETLRF